MAKNRYKINIRNLAIEYGFKDKDGSGDKKSIAVLESIAEQISPVLKGNFGETTEGYKSFAECLDDACKIARSYGENHYQALLKIDQGIYKFLEKYEREAFTFLINLKILEGRLSAERDVEGLQERVERVLRGEV